MEEIIINKYNYEDKLSELEKLIMADKIDNIKYVDQLAEAIENYEEKVYPIDEPI